MEKMNLRPFDQLNKDKKVEAILAAVMEAVSRDLALDFAGIDYNSLTEPDQQRIDAVFAKYTSDAEDKYIVGEEKRNELSQILDLKSVYKKIADNMCDELDL